MNLRDFSLMKEDKHSYTVGHPMGKMVTVPKAGLSEQAHRLISGLKKHENFDEGGAIPVNVESPSLPPPENFPESPDPIADSLQTPQPDLSGKPYGTGDTLYGTDKPIPQEPVAEDTSDIPRSPASKVDASSEQAAASQPSDTSYTYKPDSQSSYPSNIQGLQKAKQELEKGITAEEKIGKAQEQSFKEANRKISNLETSDQIFNRYQAKDKEFEEALNSKKIDPNRYLNNMDTGSKIASAIAMAFSGIGSAITGKENLAMQTINRAIANDIDAQKNDQSKTMNLWKMNRDAYGNEAQANLSAQNQYLLMAKNKVQQAMGAQMGDLARARGAQMMLGIDQQIATNNWMSSRVGGGGSPGTEQKYIGEMNVMKLIRPDLHKDMQAKYIPNVGIATRDVPEDAHKAFTSYDEMLTAIHHAKDFVNKTDWTLPHSENDARAKIIKGNITTAMNSLNGLNRLNDIEFHTFSDMLDSVGGLSRADRGLAQLDELQHHVLAKKGAESRSLGIIPFSKSQDVAVARVWAQQNMNSPDPGVRQYASSIANQVGSPGQSMPGAK